MVSDDAVATVSRAGVVGTHPGMRSAATIAWLITAGGGLTMAVIWAVNGGLRQEDAESGVRSRGASEPPGVARTHISLWMISTHALLAVTALGFFLYYLARRDSVQTGVESAPWLVLGLLLLVAGLGVGMARRWSAARKAQRSEGRSRGRRSESADQAIPTIIVHAHGLAAAVTIVLVLLVALRVGS